MENRINLMFKHRRNLKAGRIAPVVFVMLLMFSYSFDAEAGPFRQFGFDSSAIAGGNSDIAYGDSYGVLYSNPALMSRFEPKLGAEFYLIKPNLNVDLMSRPDNADIPMILYGMENADGFKNKPLATSTLRNKRSDSRVEDVQTYVGVGVTHSFGIKGFRVGGIMVVPMFDMVTIQSHFSDEREQYFSNKLHYTRFGEWQPKFTGILGVSYSPIKYISLGLALQGTASTVAGLDIYIPEAVSQNYMLVNDKIIMAGKIRPIIGVQAEPLDFLSIGVTWRMESYMDIQGQGQLSLFSDNYSAGDVGEKFVPRRAESKFNMAIDYEPMELSTGVGFKMDGWVAQATFTWNRWSEFLDMHAERPQEAARFAPVNQGDPRVNGDHYKWSDTISATAGLSYQYFSWAKAKIGGGYYPSPTPPQTGRTNYVDSDVWCMALGHDFQWGDLPFHTAFAFQLWMMTPREVNKDPNQIPDEFQDNARDSKKGEPISAAQGLQTNNPGYPGYGLEGWLMVMNVSITYIF